MKQEIKVGNTLFEFESILVQSVTDIMNDWYKLVEQQKNDEDVWIVLPELPQYIFKNLRVKSGPFETTEEASEITITFKCDDFQLDTNKNETIKTADSTFEDATDMSKYKLGDFDVWYQPCGKCGYDEGKSTLPRAGNKTCWVCGSFIRRDYSIRALKKN